MFEKLARGLGVAFLAGTFLVSPALAQSNKPLRLIVPFSAGGTADILPRCWQRSCATAFRTAS